MEVREHDVTNTSDMFSLVVRAIEACNYGHEKTNEQFVRREVLSGRRVSFIGKQGGVAAVITGLLYPPNYLAIDALWSSERRSTKGPQAAAALASAIRQMKDEANRSGVLHIYTQIHEDNPQKDRLLRFYIKALGFRRESIRLYAPIDEIRKV